MRILPVFFLRYIFRITSFSTILLFFLSANADNGRKEISSIEKELTAEKLFALESAEGRLKADPFVLRLMKKQALARQILAAGDFVKEGGKYQVHTIIRKKVDEPAVMFRIEIQMPGYPKLNGFFKPRQTRYKDWATEIAVCRLARHLDIGIAPCYERRIPRYVLKDALRLLPTEHKERLLWDKNGQSIYGFFRIWAPSFRNRIGQYIPKRSVLRMLALSLSVRNRARVLKSKIHQQLADIFLLDFLVYNNDRRRNLGTILKSNGELLLFPIDFGDGLTAQAGRKLLCKELLMRTGLFRKHVVKKLENLTKGKIKRLFHHSDYGYLVKERQIDILLKQRTFLLKHIKWMKHRFGKRVFI